jgi:hypothetical protein
MPKHCVILEVLLNVGEDVISPVLQKPDENVRVFAQFPFHWHSGRLGEMQAVNVGIWPQLFGPWQPPVHVQFACAWHEAWFGRPVH